MRPRAAKRGLLTRFLGLFSEVKPGEAGTALTLLFTIFILLVAYYVLKTVREPLVLVSASVDLQLVRNTSWPQWLKDVLLDEDAGGPQIKAVAAGLQALVLLAYVPAYAWVASKVSRKRLIIGVCLFFVAGIETFFFLRLLGVPMLGFIFYIWLGIFSVSMIAQFWSFGNDIYTKDQGERLFPIIGIGATAGGPVGAKVASWMYDYVAPEAPDDGSEVALDAFQRWLIGLELDPSFILLQLPAVLLLVFMAMMILVARRYEPGGREHAPRDEPEPAETETDDEAQPLPKTTTRGAFALLLKSPYLRLIGLVILLLNLVNTTGEFMLSEVAVQTAQATVGPDQQGAWVGRFYGDFFLYVNVLAFVLQAFVVSRLVKYLGLRAVLFALPIVAFGTYSMFALGLGLVVLRWAKTAENATDYSIMNTGKALVWLPTSRAAKYQGKQAVDTLVVRIGDVAASLLFLVGTIGLELGVRGLGMISLGFVAAWLGATYLLVRKNRQLAADPASDPFATT